MVELLRRFLFDGEFFASRIRLVFFAVGTLFTQGIISLDVLSEKMGPVGWWVGVALMCIGVAIRGGDVTPEAAKNLAKGDPEKVNALLVKVGAAPLTNAQQATDEKQAPS